jgi:hypothetical protein
MAEKVGELTNEKTKVGRPVYKTPEGDKVSEISVTIPLGNKWINVPSIHDGVKYSEDELIQMLMRNQIEATSVHDSVEEAVKAAEERSPSLLAKGGSMESQMKMFEAGGIASQKDKASNASSELDERLKKGISEDVTKQDGTTVSKTYKDPTYAAEDLLRMLRAGEITVEQAEQFLSEQKESGNYAKGGFEQGGLYQEGGTTDPVSGNEVPTGSLQEEVRDDIDAKLSEGEFVFPADVVRYIGLENLMQLRQKAKEGLGKMEDMGQMGNSEEAIMDDDLEYNADIDSLIDEFDPDEPDSMEFAVGGAVPGLNIPSFNPKSYMSSSGSLPSYSQFMGGPSVPQYSSKQYIGPNGDIITITFLNGNPVQQIPEGYKVFTIEEIAEDLDIDRLYAPACPTKC